MRFVALLYLSTVLNLTFQSQVILNVEGDVLEKENFFNSDFIHNNEIKNISGTYMIKRDGESIKDRPGKISYTFNKDGLLTELYQISVVAGFRDTIHIMYRYTLNGKVSERIEYSNRGYNSHQIEYSEKGLLVQENHFRVRDIDKQPEVFEPGKEHLISSTKYTWKEVNDTTMERVSYNNNSLPFYKETTCTSKDGFLIECKSQIVTTKETRIIEYRYNGQSWISEKHISSSGSSQVKVYKFDYDSIGMLLKESYFILNDEKKFKEILYKEDGMLEAIIEKNMDTGKINICKYTTTYY